MADVWGSGLVERERQHFADRNPKSRAAYDRARAVLPGGHARTILSHAPFHLTFIGGQGAKLTDADGHTYIDLLGDFTAGLFGHSERRVLDVVAAALRGNANIGGCHPAETELAELMCARFGMDRVRFTNSGTEANLMAITSALQYTGRSKVLVFFGGYHGGLLYFASGPAPWNVPYDFVVAPYNDLHETCDLIDRYQDDLAAVMAEPMLGSGGCIPATTEFLQGVFAAAESVGAVSIADEVMTSRHGVRGMASLLGVTPDLTTFGKYIGGGFSFGAFGGRADLLDQFDSSLEANRSRVISHAGTFNNNLATMSAGAAVLGTVFPPETALRLMKRGDDFRETISGVIARHGLPVSVTGYGSMMSIHALASPPGSGADMGHRDPILQELLFLGLLERGVYIANRGMINVGLAHSDDQLALAADALGETLSCLDRLRCRGGSRRS